MDPQTLRYMYDASSHIYGALSLANSAGWRDAAFAAIQDDAASLTLEIVTKYDDQGDVERYYESVGCERVENDYTCVVKREGETIAIWGYDETDVGTLRVNCIDKNEPLGPIVYTLLSEGIFKHSEDLKKVVILPIHHSGVIMASLVAIKFGFVVGDDDDDIRLETTHDVTTEMVISQNMGAVAERVSQVGSCMRFVIEFEELNRIATSFINASEEHSGAFVIKNFARDESGRIAVLRNSQDETVVGSVDFTLNPRAATSVTWHTHPVVDADATTYTSRVIERRKYVLYPPSETDLMRVLKHTRPGISYHTELIFTNVGIWSVSVKDYYVSMFGPGFDFGLFSETDFAPAFNNYFEATGYWSIISSDSLPQILQAKKRMLKILSSLTLAAIDAPESIKSLSGYEKVKNEQIFCARFFEWPAVKAADGIVGTFECGNLSCQTRLQASAPEKARVDELERAVFDIEKEIHRLLESLVTARVIAQKAREDFERGKRTKTRVFASRFSRSPSPRRRPVRRRANAAQVGRS